jgi:hypothetical protein
MPPGSIQKSPTLGTGSRVAKRYRPINTLRLASASPKLRFWLTFPHYRMSSLREIGGASRSILGPYAN